MHIESGDITMATTSPIELQADTQTDHRRARGALKVASGLWFLWGVFHIAVGVAFVAFLVNEHPTGELSPVPETVEVDFFGSDSMFASIAFMKQNGFNLAWIGGLVTIASVFVWRRSSRSAVATCVVLGGLADLGYFVFVDLAGFADPPGPQMTYIMAIAIALAGYAYFTTKRFRDLQPT